ncbi:hypothetical protein KRX57_03660 [Weeksellaceae bacterium TAE3-ERU29]|nr:hypothetical protein [Weeksellaceae bacterium TAE3-ERU29]
MKIYIIIASLLGLISLPKTQAQIKTNVPVNADILNQNPFIDASSQSAYPSVGKGIVFPRTNLTTFKFKTDLFDGLGLVFPTAFDGMLVYNTHVEENATIDDPATGTYTLDLKEGFYYFSNPTGNTSGNLAGGRWKPLGSGVSLASFYSQNGTLSGDREVNLDNHNLNFTGGKVGINTTDPKGSMEISYNSTWDETKPQGLNIPNVSSDQRSKFVDTKVGMLIYNTTKKCIEMYQGIVNGAHQWQCLPDAGSAQSQSVAVSSAGFEGQYISGVALTDANKVKFKLQNNGFAAINNVDFSDAVTIQNGTSNIQVAPNQNNDVSLSGGETKTLIYKLTGTPESGNLTATFDKLGLQADQSIQVGLGSATLSNRERYIVSMVYNSTTLQGKINNGAEKVTLEIPYTNGQGSYNAVSITQTSAPGQNNDTNELTLNIQPNTFNAAGNLTGTIEVGGDGEYLVRQLAPGATYDIATFNVDMNGSNFQVVLKGIGGILDKKFGDGVHNFVYLPVQVTTPTGYNKTWLNLNLGAAAAKLGSAAFDPTISETGASGYAIPKIYGGLYQWQRPTDGHEYRYSPTINTRANNWQATSPSSIVGKFILSNYSNKYSWVSNGSNDASGANVELWRSGKPNNPCPTGFHVPTHEEWVAVHEAITGHSDGVVTYEWYNQTLLPNLINAGYRSDYAGEVRQVGEYAWYASSTAVVEGRERSAYVFYMSKHWADPNQTKGSWADGMSVRCIQD